MRYIHELREGEMVSEVYLCKNKITGKTKSGKSYYSLQLVDASGTMDGKIWELNSGIGHFESMNYVKVDGQVTSFNNTLQLTIKKIRIAEEGEYDINDYMPCTKKNVDEMFDKLLGIIATIEKPYYKKLLESFFVEDKALAKEFKKHSAAKSIHHGFVGGLLEHTLAVTSMCDYYTTYSPILNRDLLLTAAMLHDIGKVYELSTFPENDYTDDGQLLGHIIIGSQMVKERIDAMPGFPKKLESELIHCILAHHGELEYGSPKKPALIEAMALNLADNADARMETMTEVLRGAGDNMGWLGYNRFMETNVRRTSEE